MWEHRGFEDWIPAHGIGNDRQLQGFRSVYTLRRARDWRYGCFRVFEGVGLVGNIKNAIMFFSSLSFLEQTCILTGILELVTKLDLRLTNLKRQELLTRYDGYSFSVWLDVCQAVSLCHCGANFPI